MADITATKFQSKGSEGSSKVKERVFAFDLDADGIGAAATHNLVNIPEGEAFLDAQVIWTELPVTGTSVQFLATSSGTDMTFTGALATANCTIGSVIELRSNLANTETGANMGDLYHDGTVVTSLTLDITCIGTTFTAGKFMIVMRTLDLNDYSGDIGQVA